MIALMFSPELSAVSLYFETSVFLITFILLGRYLESVAKGRTSQAISKLMSLQADRAVLLELNNNGEIISELEMDCVLVQRNDVLKVTNFVASQSLYLQQ